MSSTKTSLENYPIKDGFRCRGMEMTRLETFTDAAFAFATTLLVIAGDSIPKSFDELMIALKGVPAFALSFATIGWLWYEHKIWSRRYGLEDGKSTLLTLCLVFIMLVYVYPLKMVFFAFCSWATQGWLPTSFQLQGGYELTELFTIYGIGFFAVTLVFALLYWRAFYLRTSLQLDAFETMKTRQSLALQLVLCATGLVSALCAWLLPMQLGVFSGFVYSTLPITMTVTALYIEKQFAKQQPAAND